MTCISLEQAQRAIAGAIAEGEALELKPLSVAIVDAGSHLIALARTDGASTMRPQISIGKAAGALALGVSSRRIAEMAVERPTFIGALAPHAFHGMVPAAGGIIIVDNDGRVIGAIGVTGDTSDNDEACALAGITAAGLTAQG